MTQRWRPGATYMQKGSCQFTVWAPFRQKVEVRLISPEELVLPMEKDAQGYHRATIDGVEPGSLYLYRLDGQLEHPDPASRHQPQGVHGPSQVVAPDFAWQDSDWNGLPLHDYIIYELHVGAFTAEGTFDAIIPCLDELTELGITAVELMPVAQFPVSRNWGYDGVYPFAAQDSYGGPDGLRRLVNACHQRGLAIILDVVYNHLGPEGNYLTDFGPYFTDRYKTPWGAAINFDGPYSDEVRRFFIENALCWITDFHIDALRLDALHAILDISPRPFLEELAASVQELTKSLNRQAYLIGESAANDARLIRPPEIGGYGLDAQWNDDFHHALHVLLTGEQSGYYEDFGGLRHLAKAFREGFVYSGEYSPYRKRRHGISSKDIPADRFVVFAQNHDQVGNRALSERLSQIISFEGLKLAAGAVLLSPFIPLLFMGEEYGEKSPFPYFVSHTEPELIEAVRRGRRDEFAAFRWQGEMPDPQDEATFLSAKLNRGLCGEGRHRTLLELYKELIQLRKGIPALAHLSKEDMEALSYEEHKILFIRRWTEKDEAAIVFNFNNKEASAALPLPSGLWRKRLDSADERWGGDGSPLPQELSSKGEATLSFSPWSFALLTKEN